MTRVEALGIWAIAPRGLTANPRRRRLAFVGATAPGVLAAVLGPQLSHDPLWLGSGLAHLLLVFLARRCSEPRFVAWEAQVADPSTRDLSHDP